MKVRGVVMKTISTNEVELGLREIIFSNYVGSCLLFY